MPQGGRKRSMGKNKQKAELFSVMYSYVGTDTQFDEFLKMMIHDYLAADHPCIKSEPQIVGSVELEKIQPVPVAIEKNL